MNANQILEWAKANLVILIFLLVMIAAPIAMYFVAGGMNKRVRDEVNSRAMKLSQMSVSVTLPQGDVVPTESLLQQYERVTKTLADDATAVQKRAVEFNRKARGVLKESVFPEPPFELREIIPRQFHDRLTQAYGELLTEVRAGSPPSLESLREQLEGMRTRYISQDLKKDPGAPLDPEEDARLKKMLSEARVGMYKQAAAGIGLYATADALFIPAWNQARIPSPAEMFNWQWQYWAIDDVLRALASVNKDSSSVADAPVKRVLGIVINDLPEVKGGDESGAAPSQPRLSGGFGSEGADAQTPPPTDQGAAEAMPSAGGAANPKAPITRDYSTSLSGLVTNPLFDVLTVDFAIIVDTARLPEVLDAVSRYNFNTITNLRVESTDSFAATEQGFFYGKQPVSAVTLRMETVWLREWTKQFMPPATREALSIPPDAPAAPAAVPAAG